MMAAPSSTMRRACAQRRVGREELAAVGEGIGRDVEHAHDHGRAEIERAIPALPAGDGAAHDVTPPAFGAAS